MRQLSIGRVLVVGTMAATTVLLVNIAISITTDSTSLLRWLTVPVIGTVAAVLSALDQQRSRASDEVGALPALVLPRRARRRDLLTRGFQRLVAIVGGPTMTTAVILSVAVLGVGGTVVATATRYGMDWVTGNEPRRRPTRQNGDGHRRRRHGHGDQGRADDPFHSCIARGANDTGVSINLPVGEGNVLLVAGDGTTRQAGPFRSEWTEAVPSGATRRGTITFAGHLPADSNRARITFVKVFGFGDNVPDSLTVSGIQLGPPGWVDAIAPLSNAARSVLHRDSRPDRPCRLGHRVFPRALARAAHHQQVSVAEGEADTPATDAAGAAAGGLAQRDDRDHRVLGPAAADGVAVPGDAVATVAVEAEPGGGEGLAQLDE